MQLIADRVNALPLYRLNCCCALSSSWTRQAIFEPGNETIQTTDEARFRLRHKSGLEPRECVRVRVRAGNHGNMSYLLTLEWPSRPPTRLHSMLHESSPEGIQEGDERESSLCVICFRPTYHIMQKDLPASPASQRLPKARGHTHQG